MRFQRVVAPGLIALGLIARCADWCHVFVNGDISLVPADTHYYIRFALRQIASFPRFRSFDPYVSFPTGAHIYWPPLHTWIVAGMIRLFGVTRPELGAALVDPVVAGVELVIVWACAERLYGLGRAWLILGAYALLPAAVFSAPIGSADHHVHEPFFIAIICLLLGRGFQEDSLSRAAFAGVVLGASRLFTPLTPLIATATAAGCAAGAVLVPRVTAGFVSTFGVSAAAVLALEAIAFGDPRSLAYESLSSFQPLFTLSMFLAVAAATELLGSSRKRAVRWWLIPAALASALPLWPELHRAAEHFGRLDPILSEVSESQPMTLAGAWAFLSAGVLLAPLAAWGAFRRVRHDRPEAIPALAAAVVLLIAAVQQIRFVQAFAGAASVLIGLGLPFVFDGLRWERILRGATYALSATICALSLVPAPTDEWDLEVARLRPVMRWIEMHTPPASADPMSDDVPAYGVVASPLLGHLLTLWAERPAVATTFSQAPEFVAGSERVARVFAASTEQNAYEAMRATGGRYLLLTRWLKPFGHSEVDVRSTFVTRLFEGKVFETGHFRLVHNFETGAKLFEVVSP